MTNSSITIEYFEIGPDKDRFISGRPDSLLRSSLGFGSLFGLLWQKNSLNVGQDASLSNGNTS